MKPAVRTLLDDPASTVNRRSFFKTLGLGAAGAAAWTREAAADAAANFVQANVKRASEPSALKITDLRFAVIVSAPMTCPVIRIDTNQGLVGWGEVRDGSSETYALVPQEPHPRREPLQRRQGVPEDQAVRRAGPAGRRGVRHRDGDDGSGRQGVGRAVLADARRQVPRPRPALCRHHRARDGQGAGRDAQGAHGRAASRS